MQEILLTRGLKCFVDDNVYDVVRYYKWWTQETRANGATNFMAKRTVAPFSMKLDVYLHRLTAGVPKCFRIRFKDENWLNYQHDNLRIEDKKGRKYQFHKFNRDSQYKGVVFDLYYGVWRAEFHKLIIGYYHNEVDAAHAYNVKIREIYKHPGRKINTITIMEHYYENNPRYRQNG